MPLCIESLTPQPLPDLRRVTLNLRVLGLPVYGPGAKFCMTGFSDVPLAEQLAQAQPSPNVDLFPDAPPPAGSPDGGGTTLGDERPSSPYPDVTLSIFDQHGNEVAGMFIIEHKEPELDFTLHLRTFEPGNTYTARAEMTLNNEVIQKVEVPFELK